MPMTTSHCSWPGLTRAEFGLRIAQVGDLHVLGGLDLFLGAVEDENRLGAPEHLDDLAFGDRGEVDLDRRARGDGRGVRTHLGNQRRQGRRHAHGADGTRGYIEKVAASRSRRRHGRHVSRPLPPWLGPGARGRHRQDQVLRDGGRTDRRLPWRTMRRIGGVLLAPLRSKRKPKKGPGGRGPARFARKRPFVDNWQRGPAEAGRFLPAPIPAGPARAKGSHRMRPAGRFPALPPATPATYEGGPHATRALRA